MTGVIRGTVYNDVNANRVRDTGESSLSNVTIGLYDGGGGLIASQITNSSGAYMFSGLVPGNYTVVETDPTGYVSTTPNSVAVTVPAGGTQTVDFGDYRWPQAQPSAIIGTVFNDLNSNGSFDRR